MKKWFGCLSVVLFVVLVVGSGFVMADFPEDNVTVIIPWGAGGRTDIAARVWAPFLEQELGQTVIVSNLPGAGGVTGSNALIRETPDGYTFGVLSISLNLAQWTKIPPFEMHRLEPVCMIFASPMSLTVHVDSPWQTLQDYVDYVQANPGTVLHSASGSGTSQHVISAAFHNQADLDVIFVPYDGDGPAALALANQEVRAAGSPMIALGPYMEAEEVRVLGLSSRERSPLFPDIPTFREQGIDFALESFDGIYVPEGTPLEVIQVLEEAFGRMAENPEFIEAMHQIYYEVSFMPRAEFIEFLDETNALLEDVVDELGLKL